MTHMRSDSIDDTYLQLVTSLLMEKDTLFRSDRSDSMTSEDRDDFMPLVSEFLIPQRDRAFSWDVSFEEGLSGEEIQALAEQSKIPILNGKSMPPPNLPLKQSPPKSSAEKGLVIRISGDINKKDQIPSKKRKLDKTELNTKKIKIEPTKQVVPNENEFAKPLSRTTANSSKPSSPNKNDLIAKSISTSASSSSAKKLALGIKIEDKSNKNEIAIRLPTSLSVPCQSPSTSMSPSISMLVPQATNVGLIVNSSGHIAPPPVGLSLINRIPLLASDFGPANGVPNGDGCRVGVYTREERLVRIERFREKKQKRIWRKQIKYDCRKRLADTRPRVKGRFVSRIGENGEELPPEPKPADLDLNNKIKKKKIGKLLYSGPQIGIEM